MWDVVSALLPPLVMAAVFCALVFTLLRREIGAKRPDPRDARRDQSRAERGEEDKDGPAE